MSEASIVISLTSIAISCLSLAIRLRPEWFRKLVFPALDRLADWVERRKEKTP